MRGGQDGHKRRQQRDNHIRDIEFGLRRDAVILGGHLADHLLDGLDGELLAGLEAPPHAGQAVHAPGVLEGPVAVHALLLVAALVPLDLLAEVVLQHPPVVDEAEERHLVPAGRADLVDVDDDDGPRARHRDDVLAGHDGVEFRRAVFEDAPLAPEAEDTRGTFEGVEDYMLLVRGLDN